MNLISEQITSKGEVIIDQDQPLKFAQIFEVFYSSLGGHIHLRKYKNHSLIVYENEAKKILILTASITYLGGNGQHPTYKKRIQLKSWYKDVFLDDELRDFEKKIIGLYHYENNVIFVNFEANTYLRKKMNNSAAHVYINDLYKAKTDGIFNKVDMNNNVITTISSTRLKDYLDESFKLLDEIEIIKSFNQYIEKRWIYAIEVIEAMRLNNFSNWAQAEWQGWYLEYKFDKFLKDSNIKSVEYIGNRRENNAIFDLFFLKQNFYSDLKASSSNYNESLGNDQSELLDSLEEFGKFWYIIYEHETILDKNSNSNYSATKFMNELKLRHGKWPKSKPYDEESYSSKMKYAVRFSSMFVLEINPSNYKHILTEFKQGHQSTGEDRNSKFKISKRNIDNFLIYKEEFKK